MRLVFTAPQGGLREVSGRLEIALPNRLLGDSNHVPAHPVGEAADFGAFRWIQENGWSWGAATIDCCADGTRTASELLYRRLFTQLGGRHLYRIWNFVPRINKQEAGLEVYQQFSFGRSVAFEAAFPGGVEERIPAASAVGTSGDHLVVVVVAGAVSPRFFENPLQVPAYRYPLDYGPRAPSFARATTATVEGVRRVFLSGTSAIRGSSSQYVGDIIRQTQLTLDNLRIVADESGVDLMVGESSGRTERFFRIYLRHADDYAAVKAILDEQLIRTGDSAEFVQAEICRADLAVEIEATLTIND